MSRKMPSNENVFCVTNRLMNYHHFNHIDLDIYDFYLHIFVLIVIVLSSALAWVAGYSRYNPGLILNIIITTGIYTMLYIQI